MGKKYVFQLCCLITIIASSYYFIHSKSGEVSLLSYLHFSFIIVAGLVLYESFKEHFLNNKRGVLIFFFGRVIFISIIVYTNFSLMNNFRTSLINNDGISIYAIAGEISSRYIDGKYRFFRGYTYNGGGKKIHKMLPFNYNLRQGDTLYLKYSKSQPLIIEFENNGQNRKHGIID